jgi:hypothetical protein
LEGTEAFLWPCVHHFCDEIDCKEDVERSFHALLADLGKKGWHPAEAAMALADTADIMAFPVGPSLHN